jgi:hypothetical protein
MPSTKQRRRAKRHADRLVEEAIEAAAADKPLLAEKLIQRALSAGPANARFWLENARIAHQRGLSRRAERSVRRALELSPHYAEAQELMRALVPPREPPPPALAAAGDDDELLTLARTERYDWATVEDELTTRGLARLPALATADECVALRALYTDPARFEHEVRIADERGRVDYRFFRRPLPELVVALRREVYARLAPIANRWNDLVGDARRWPPSHAAFERDYRAAGHGRTAPILLRYEPGGFNGFHRDVYGAIYFPLQLVVSLGPAELADGGELMLVDDRPGKRKRIRTVATNPGDAVVFCTRDRLCPIAGLYGRQAVMHGAQEVRRERYAVGIPFHDYQG